MLKYTASPATAESRTLKKTDALSDLEAEISFVGPEELETMQYSKQELDELKLLISCDATGDTAQSSASPLGQLTARSRPLLSAEEERMLFRRMNYVRFQAEAIRSALPPTRPAKIKLAKIEGLLEEAAAIRRRIAESNLRLVASITRKYAYSPQQVQDYLSDGLLILLGAIEKFDYSRGYRFSTYATHSIQRHFFRLSQRHQRYTQRFVLTPGEVMAEVACAEEPESAQKNEAEKMYRQLMESARDRLNEREQSVLQRRFGTDGHRVTQTLREVASDLGLSKERVRQIQIAALKKLRDAAVEFNLMPTHG